MCLTIPEVKKTGFTWAAEGSHALRPPSSDQIYFCTSLWCCTLVSTCYPGNGSASGPRRLNPHSTGFLGDPEGHAACGIQNDRSWFVFLNIKSVFANWPSAVNPSQDKWDLRDSGRGSPLIICLFLRPNCSSCTPRACSPSKPVAGD